MFLKTLQPSKHFLQAEPAGNALAVAVQQSQSHRVVFSHNIPCMCSLVLTVIIVLGIRNKGTAQGDGKNRLDKGFPLSLNTDDYKRESRRLLKCSVWAWLELLDKPIG